MKTIEIKLEEEKAVAKVWNKEHKAWFYLIPDDTIGCFNGFLKFGEHLYLSSSLTTAPWLWGQMIDKDGHAICYKMSKEELLDKLKKLKDLEHNDRRYEATELILQYFEDEEITTLYNKLMKGELDEE